MHLANTKGKIDSAKVLVDDLQLEEASTDSPRYMALAAVNTQLEEANDLIKCRLDLIKKADHSKIGWSAAAVCFILVKRLLTNVSVKKVIN